MRISDWSSDVCSSDLVGREAEAEGLARRLRNAALRQIFARGRAVAAAELPREPVGGRLHDIAQARRLLGLFAARGSAAGTSIPASAASSLTASMKLSPRWSVIQRIASPCAEQPKQW